MATGLSIHIGLNFVDPDCYDGWDGQLTGCINDARDMQGVADRLGYQSSIMIDSQATAANVVRAIGQTAQRLVSGDILLLTYSGHGSQVSDVNSDEPDAQDETWVLWDRLLLDDELHSLWSQFRSGVRVFVLSDSCHSGTVLKMAMYKELANTPTMVRQYRTRSASRNQAQVAFRAAPRHVVDAVFERNRAMYETTQWTSGGDRATVTASVLLISGCQDHQLSADGARNGLFTETLLRVWNGGAFNGNYARFHGDICEEMPPQQMPNLFRAGTVDPAFEAQKPFTIAAASDSPGPAVRPTITAPAQFSNTATPPSFTVNPGIGRHYAVEVTTNPYYFNNAQYGAQRTDDNFFGSWKTPPFGSASSYPAQYTMPQAAWDRLRRAGGRLYYRLWATDSPSAWVQAVSTTPDASAPTAPSITLTASGGPLPDTGAVPSIETATTVPNGATPPRFTVDPGPNRYYAVEVTTNPYYFMNSTYGSQRTDDNFFASWKTPPFASSPSYPATYVMPSTPWNRLRASAARLYYRLWVSDDPNRWVNATSDTLDSNALAAKSFAIAREGAAELEPEPTQPDYAAATVD